MYVCISVYGRTAVAKYCNINQIKLNPVLIKGLHMVQTKGLATPDLLIEDTLLLPSAYDRAMVRR